MRRHGGLTLKLAAAFLVVAALTLVLVLAAVERTTAGSFRSYVQHQRMMEQRMPGPIDPPGMRAPLFDQAEASFFDRFRVSLVLGGLGGSAIALVAGALIARRITRPLLEIEDAARAVASGDTTRRAAVDGSDEIAALAASFNVMAESLADQERQRQQFIADIAHELRTPLAVLQGEIEALQDGMVAPDAARLASLHEETQLLTRLVADLGTLSLADTGRLELRRSAQPLAPVVRRVVGSMEEAAARAGVRLATDAPADLPEVDIDADRVAQVLANLLANAIRHTPAGGSVSLSAAARDGGIEVRVRDTGSGIPAEALPHVFERFFRADASRSRRLGGSGLGLAIARQLVHAHGGEITAANNPDRGATFAFTLPCAAATSAAPLSAPAAREAAR